MKDRITRDEWGLKLAIVTGQRSTCIRRQVGCVLMDKDGRIISTGYNGVPSGWTHCIDSECQGARHKSGEGLDDCIAIHAEQNALLQCGDVREIHTVFVTSFPCITCIKLLLNTGAKRIVYLDDYPHEKAKELWTQAGRTYTQIKL